MQLGLAVQLQAAEATGRRAVHQIEDVEDELATGIDRQSAHQIRVLRQEGCQGGGVEGVRVAVVGPQVRDARVVDRLGFGGRVPS